MQTALPSARVLSPLSVGLIIGFGLLFVVVAVVRATIEQPSNIDQATQAGQAALQNSIANALPAFSLQAETTPLPVVDNPWLRSDWLGVAIGGSGDRWVWANAWYSCLMIDRTNLTYPKEGTGTSYAEWTALTVRQQWNVIEVCNE